MTEPPWAADPNRSLTEVEAFDAMVEFVRAFWERSGRPQGDLEYFLLIVGRSDIGTTDPAHWEDWQKAIAAARANPKGG